MLQEISIGIIAKMKLNNNLNKKYENLKNYLKSLNSAIVAFSAGVDSTLLLKVAHDILGDKVIALSAKTCSFPQKELREAIEFCKCENIKHAIIETQELNLEQYRKNPPNRCYICKKEIFSKIIEFKNQNNIEVILEGSNLDDDSDYRPGTQAIKELGIISPLKIAKLTKEEIRILSKENNLKTSSKPSFACLASRLSYGEEITKEKLLMIEKAEDFLSDLGFLQYRVRLHNNLARIEVLESDFEKLLKSRSIITAKFRELGFKYISMDLTGYKMGSMNETIK